MKKRILVTGGAGFLGSHLCEKLLDRGDEVICLDNFYTGSKLNVVHLLENPYFEILRHDVVQPINVEVDEIYNLACPASPVHYQKDPVKTTVTSVSGAIHVLDLAHRLGAKVLQASTSEVYGDPQVHPQTESYNGNVSPTGPRACYDEGKRCAETLFYDYKRQLNVDVRVARIFNTYGPRMSATDGRVVSNFIVQALQGTDLTLHGEGKQTRSFCYVDDLVEGLILLMDSNYDKPVNLGNPAECTIAKLANTVLDLTDSRSVIINEGRPIDDPNQRQPDITLARKELGWNPKIDLREGLNRTIRYFKELP